jgi:hypothetical protein
MHDAKSGYEIGRVNKRKGSLTRESDFALASAFL